MLLRLVRVALVAVGVLRGRLVKVRLALALRVRVAVSPGVVLLVLRVVLVLSVVLVGLLRLVARGRVAVAPGVVLRVLRVGLRVVVVLLVLRVVLLAWLGLGRRAVVRRRMRRGGVTMRWCVWMAWMSPLLV